jgi:hypothetical protein
MYLKNSVKPKYVFIENVFGSKDWVERRKAWENALLIGTTFI